MITDALGEVLCVAADGLGAPLSISFFALNPPVGLTKPHCSLLNSESCCVKWRSFKFQMLPPFLLTCFYLF